MFIPIVTKAIKSFFCEVLSFNLKKHQRHCLAAFRRRSFVFTRSLEYLAIFMALFTRFRINGSIDELIALLE